MNVQDSAPYCGSMIYTKQKDVRETKSKLAAEWIGMCLTLAAGGDFGTILMYVSDEVFSQLC